MVQDKVWRVKNNAYDILLVISPAKDGKTRIVPFVYLFDDIHSASAKDIPRYCLKIVITGDGIGTSQSFSLSAYKFMTGEQPTKDMQGLYPSVSWTEEERCGANAVRNVMVSAEMHSDAMQASNRAFCPQEWRPQSPDFSQGNGTPLSSPRYQSGSHGSRSPEMA